MGSEQSRGSNPKLKEFLDKERAKQKTNGNAGEPYTPAPEGDDDFIPRFWPDPFEKPAFHGLAGEFVDIVSPQSESDPAALLMQFLVGFGSLLNRGPYVRVEGDRHYTNEFLVLAGTTAKGRKGTAWGRCREVLSQIDETWTATRIFSGLGSGEALVDTCGGEDPDKRVLLYEPEFARLLTVVNRDGSTLSAIVREAWDTGSLSILTRKKQVQVQDAHISLIGHITCEELRKRIADVEMVNGFVNRILFQCVRRSKLLPFGGEPLDMSEISGRFRQAVQFARTLGNTRVPFALETRELWVSVYADLTRPRPGIGSAVLNRADPHVLRLALIYALLDRSHSLKPEHLQAALAVWKRCEQSADYIWTGSLMDQLAEKVLSALEAAEPAGMTRNDLYNHFGRNISGAEIKHALDVLLELASVRCIKETGNRGRPSFRFFVISKEPSVN